MKKFILCTITLMFLLTGCNGKTDEEQTKTASATEVHATEQTTEAAAASDSNTSEDLQALAKQLTDYMSAGDTDKAMAMMDDEMIKALDGKLADIWDGLTTVYGKFKESNDYSYSHESGYDVIEAKLVFENGSATQRTVFDSVKLVAGLYFTPIE